MTVTHATFVIERRLSAAPNRVFAAYTSLEAKAAWFKTPSDAKILARDFDFRVGGKERFHARWPSGLVTDFQATYHDIVENERLVLVYDLLHGGEKLSVSLQTIELRAEGNGTRLIHTEQGSYFSGGIEAVQGREHGTTWHVDNLVAILEGRETGALA
ncbi:SRPBCC family protein [Sphingomonas sp.]|uniref:SRPBCC family protein n=1 Tax=Sphingomonas sp. TaxID=28214 RepID=UPI003B3B1A7F